MSNYWKLRARDKDYNKALKLAEKELAQQYARCFNTVKQEMISVYNEILVDTKEDKVLISDLYKYNRYYDLLNNINQQLQHLGNKEIEIGNQYLTNMYKSNQEIIKEELVDQKLGQSFKPLINEENMKSAINGVWCQDGKNWSDRIWDNKSLLQERIKNGMVDCIVTGRSVEQLATQLMKDFNVGFNQADRIARTELSYVQNQSTLDSYKDAGIEYYEILDTGDERECETCADIDGKIFRLDQAQVGVNFPPFHCNCRCCILAVINK